MIKKQLDSLEVAKVSMCDEAKHRYLFKKVNSVSLEVGKSYAIQIDKNLTNKEMSGTLASNWNHGLVPLHTSMVAEVKDRMGTMYLVNGTYVDSEGKALEGEPRWEGWLPMEKVVILEVVG